MCNLRTSYYSLCGHKGPTTASRRCPGYIDSGYEIECDDPAKRRLELATIEGYCLGCRPVELEESDGEIEEEAERRRENVRAKG